MTSTNNIHDHAAALLRQRDALLAACEAVSRELERYTAETGCAVWMRDSIARETAQQRLMGAIEEVKGKTFEKPLRFAGACVHCGRGIAEHRQSRVGPTAFECPGGDTEGRR